MHQRWIFDRILAHRWSPEPGRREQSRHPSQVERVYKDPTWVHMEVIKEDDPVTLAAYAYEARDLEDQESIGNGPKSTGKHHLLVCRSLTCIPP